MIVIADSGSSKTDWRLQRSNSTFISIETKGLNPFFVSQSEIHQVVAKAFAQVDTQHVSAVYFYGAGCLKGQNDALVKEALLSVFGQANVQVEDDMLAAAKALFGTQKGIAGILGTGANSCLFDGNKIIDKVPPLGYILGDEGSGAYLGKIFLNDYFKRAIPADLAAQVDQELRLHWPTVLEAVYKAQTPNKYLASFSAFFARHKQHPYMQQLIRTGFEAFFAKNIERYAGYNNTPVGVVGSIAFHYADILRHVAQTKGIMLQTILHKPIDALCTFHTQ